MKFDYKNRPADEETLLRFRIAAVIMSATVIGACICSIIIIKRNIIVPFSLKVVSLIIIINVGFILNQIFS